MWFPRIPYKIKNKIQYNADFSAVSLQILESVACFKELSYDTGELSASAFRLKISRHFNIGEDAKI